MKKFVLAVALALTGLSTPVSAEVLDNAKVISLLGLGLGDEAVIAKIKASDGNYDISTDALVALKNAGASGPVIAAVIDSSSKKSSAALSVDSPDPKVPHATGIYMLQDWLPTPRMLAINVTTSNQTKTGGFFGYALTGGLASMSFKSVVPGTTARTVSDLSRPTFYFYFDQARNGGSSAVWTAGAVTSPNEFTLVRFEVKKENREAKVGKFNIGGAKAGVMDKDRIPFSFDEISPGVFEVKPEQPLPNGEYGFLVQTSTGSGPGLAGAGAMAAKIFDFKIASPAPVSEKKRK